MAKTPYTAIGPGGPKYKKPATKKKTIVAAVAKPIARTNVPMPPKPSYNAQQQSTLDAWKIVQPQIDAATQASLRSSDAGMGAIKGYTDQLAKSLAGYNPGEIYGRAQQSLAGINSAVSGQLAGGGQQAASQLGAALAQINAPAETQAYAGQQAQIGQQAGAAQYGLGSADLGAITSSRAAAENYAAQLPGIAGFTGLQSATSMQLQRQKALQDTVGQLVAQVPQLAAQRYGQIKDNQASAAKFKSDQAAQAFDNRLAAQAFGLKVGTAQSKAQVDAAKLQQGATKIAQTSAEKAADRRLKVQLAREKAASTAVQKKADRAAKVAKSEADAAAKRNESFYKARTAAVHDAQIAFAAGHSAAEVTAYLKSAYGTMLVGRGFSQAQVDQMIVNVVKAGKANPQAASKSKTKAGVGPKTTVGQQAAGILGGKK